MESSTRPQGLEPNHTEQNTESLQSVVASILTDYEVAEGSPALGVLSVGGKDIFVVHARKSWDKTTESRCNFEFRPRITPRAGPTLKGMHELLLPYNKTMLFIAGINNKI